MTVTERNKLAEIAMTKKDGIYSKSPYIYVVRDKNLIAFSDYFGHCYTCLGIFNVPIGNCKRHERIKVLTTYLKNL